MWSCSKCGKAMCFHQPVKTIIYSALVVVVITVLVLIIPIVKDEIDWKRARDNNSSKSYLAYSAQHPAGRHLNEALAVGAELGWKEIASDGDTQAYRSYLKHYPNSRYASQAHKRIDECSWERASGLRTIAGYNAYLSDNPKGSHVQQAKKMIPLLAEDKKIYASALAVGTKNALSSFLSNYPGHVNEQDARDALDELNLCSNGESKTGTFVAVFAVASINDNGEPELTASPVNAAQDEWAVYVQLKDGSAAKALCRGRLFRTLREGAVLEIRPSIGNGWRVFRALSNTGVKHSRRSGVFRQIRSSNNTIRLEEAPRAVAFRLGEGAWMSLDQVHISNSSQ